MNASRAQAKLPKSSRILGPYQDGARWRVVQFIDGRRTAHTATTREKASEIMRALARQQTAPHRSLAGALREYDAHLKFERRLTLASCQHAQRTLNAFLGGATDEPIASLTAEDARKLARFEHPQAQVIRRRYAVHTRYAVVGHAFRFFDWAKSHRYVERNPFDGVRPMGLIRPGPAPLSLEKARALAAVTLNSAASDPGALGALLILVLGLRSGQVLALRLADLDLDHKRLRIPVMADTFRSLAIPDLLLPCLRAAKASRPLDALLIGPGRTGKVRPHNFLWRAVQRLCKQAGVTSTSPRSLRKLHVSLSRTATQASERIPAETPPTRPLAHVAKRPVGTDAVQVIDLLGLSLAITGPRMDTLLSVLSAEQLARLWPLLDPHGPPTSPSV